MNNQPAPSKRFAQYKKGFVIALACVLLVGLLVVIPKGSQDTEEGEEAADFFYLQIYNDDNQVVSRYQVALTGEIGDESKILSVEFTCVSGDTCETSYHISGCAATVTLVHPEYGYLVKNIVMDTDGEFSVLS